MLRRAISIVVLLVIAFATAASHGGAQSGEVYGAEYDNAEKLSDEYPDYPRGSITGVEIAEGASREISYSSFKNKGGFATASFDSGNYMFFSFSNADQTVKLVYEGGKVTDIRYAFSPGNIGARIIVSFTPKSLPGNSEGGKLLAVQKAAKSPNFYLNGITVIDVDYKVDAVGASFGDKELMFCTEFNDIDLNQECWVSKGDLDDYYYTEKKLKTETSDKYRKFIGTGDRNSDDRAMMGCKVKENETIDYRFKCAQSQTENIFFKASFAAGTPTYSPDLTYRIGERVWGISADSKHENTSDDYSPDIKYLGDYNLVTWDIKDQRTTTYLSEFAGKSVPEKGWKSTSSDDLYPLPNPFRVNWKKSKKILTPIYNNTYYKNLHLNLNYESKGDLTSFPIGLPGETMAAKLTTGTYYGSGQYAFKNKVYSDTSYPKMKTVSNPTRDGYIFAGWYTNSSYGNLMRNDEMAIPNSDITLYAHWEKVPEVSVLDYSAAMGMDGGYEYRTDTDVIFTVRLSATESIHLKENLRVTFSILGNEHVVINKIVPKDKTDVICYVKFHTPTEPANLNIAVNAKFTFYDTQKTASAAFTARVVKHSVTDPPDPTAKDKANDFGFAANATLPVNAENASRSWNVYTETTSYNSADTDKVSPIYSLVSTRNEVSLQKKSLEIIANRYAATATKGGLEIKSGYGIDANIGTQLSGNAETMAVCPIQNGIFRFPEFSYKTYGRVADYLMTTALNTPYAGKTQHFRRNVFSKSEEKVHFTPLWFPDGEYKVYCHIRDAWTPAGEIRANVSGSVGIQGALYDDWHVSQG